MLLPLESLPRVEGDVCVDNGVVVWFAEGKVMRWYSAEGELIFTDSITGSAERITVPTRGIRVINVNGTVSVDASIVPAKGIPVSAKGTRAKEMNGTAFFH